MSKITGQELSKALQTSLSDSEINYSDWWEVLNLVAGILEKHSTRDRTFIDNAIFPLAGNLVDGIIEAFIQDGILQYHQSRMNKIQIVKRPIIK